MLKEGALNALLCTTLATPGPTHPPATDATLVLCYLGDSRAGPPPALESTEENIFLSQVLPP